MLIAIDNVLTGEQVREYRTALDTANWQDGAATGGSLARRVKQNLQLADGIEPALSLGHHILRTLAAHPLFISAALPRRIYPPKFNHYENGGAYGTHVDSAVMQLPGGGALRSDLSATLFLSDPDEYKGGELEIEGDFGVQAVKLDAGSMVLYPSSSLHRVTPVTGGARLASFFWIESLVADDAARAMLFDLDQTIVRLTAALEDHQAELVKLTGIYHNLLRRWART